MHEKNNYYRSIGNFPSTATKRVILSALESAYPEPAVATISANLDVEEESTDQEPVGDFYVKVESEALENIRMQCGMDIPDGFLLYNFTKLIKDSKISLDSLIELSRENLQLLEIYLQDQKFLRSLSPKQQFKLVNNYLIILNEQSESEELNITLENIFSLKSLDYLVASLRKNNLWHELGKQHKFFALFLIESESYSHKLDFLQVFEILKTYPDLNELVLLNDHIVNNLTAKQVIRLLTDFKFSTKNLRCSTCLAMQKIMAMTKIRDYNPEIRLPSDLYETVRLLGPSEGLQKALYSKPLAVTVTANLDEFYRLDPQSTQDIIEPIIKLAATSFPEVAEMLIKRAPSFLDNELLIDLIITHQEIAEKIIFESVYSHLFKNLPDKVLVLLVISHHNLLKRCLAEGWLSYECLTGAILFDLYETKYPNLTEILEQNVGAAQRLQAMQNISKTYTGILKSHRSIEKLSQYVFQAGIDSLLLQIVSQQYNSIVNKDAAINLAFAIVNSLTCESFVLYRQQIFAELILNKDIAEKFLSLSFVQETITEAELLYIANAYSDLNKDLFIKLRDKIKRSSSEDHELILDVDVSSDGTMHSSPTEISENSSEASIEDIADLNQEEQYINNLLLMREYQFNSDVEESLFYSAAVAKKFLQLNEKFSQNINGELLYRLWKHFGETILEQVMLVDLLEMLESYLALKLFAEVKCQHFNSLGVIKPAILDGVALSPLQEQLRKAINLFQILENIPPQNQLEGGIELGLQYLVSLINQLPAILQVLAYFAEKLSSGKLYYELYQLELIKGIAAKGDLTNYLQLALDNYYRPAVELIDQTFPEIEGSKLQCKIAAGLIACDLDMARGLRILSTAATKTPEAALILDSLLALELPAENKAKLAFLLYQLSADLEIISSKQNDYLNIAADNGALEAIDILAEQNSNLEDYTLVCKIIAYYSQANYKTQANMLREKLILRYGSEELIDQHLSEVTQTEGLTRILDVLKQQFHPYAIYLLFKNSGEPESLIDFVEEALQRQFASQDSEYFLLERNKVETNYDWAIDMLNCYINIADNRNRVVELINSLDLNPELKLRLMHSVFEKHHNPEDAYTVAILSKQANLNAPEIINKLIYAHDYNIEITLESVSGLYLGILETTDLHAIINFSKFYNELLAIKLASSDVEPRKLHAAYKELIFVYKFIDQHNSELLPQVARFIRIPNWRQTRDQLWQCFAKYLLNLPKLEKDLCYKAIHNLIEVDNLSITDVQKKQALLDPMLQVFNQLCSEDSELSGFAHDLFKILNKAYYICAHPYYRHKLENRSLVKVVEEHTQNSLAALTSVDFICDQKQYSAPIFMSPSYEFANLATNKFYGDGPATHNVFSNISTHAYELFDLGEDVPTQRAMLILLLLANTRGKNSEELLDFLTSKGSLNKYFVDQHRNSLGVGQTTFRKELDQINRSLFSIS